MELLKWVSNANLLQSKIIETKTNQDKTNQDKTNQPKPKQTKPKQNNQINETIASAIFLPPFAEGSIS
jgi:hypothetical protein